MKLAILLPCVLTMAVAAAVPDDARIKIATVPAEYRPNTGSERMQPVKMDSFHFEVNQETGRARVVVEYTYPHAVGYRSDGDPGPQPTMAQLPGLTYDPAANAVVFDGGGKRTVCALVPKTKGRQTLRAKSTGSCVVTASVGEHTQDDGFSLHHSRALDVYFEVH
ncbi:MAG: hypothetical protein ACLQOO_37165 [Terriglobia bacterium]